MVKSIFGKVMWVGKGTVFVVGLAVMLAAVFGVASMAFAANGNPLLLGRNNVATAITTLTKQGAGPALRLLVRPGQPPMAVNSDTKVANLNADKVDGQNAPLLVRVNSNGTLSSDDTVATVTHSPNSGYYQLDFSNRAVVGCVFQATLVNGPDGGEIAVYPSEAVSNRLAVITTATGAGARNDRNFHLILYC